MSKKCRPSSSHPCRMGMSAHSKSRGPLCLHSWRADANPRHGASASASATVIRLRPSGVCIPPAHHRQPPAQRGTDGLRERLAGRDWRHTRYRQQPRQRECCAQKSLHHLSGLTHISCKSASPLECQPLGSAQDHRSILWGDRVRGQ